MDSISLLNNIPTMTLKDLISLEDNANDVWVISPSLHYDVHNKDFSELVSVNLGQKTKYKYLVPGTKDIDKHIDLYKKLYQVTEEQIQQNFLIIPETEFLPFMMEIGIYNGNSDECKACAAPGLEDGDEVILFSQNSAQEMAKQFKSLWKKYKRTSL